jgi:hypothetical protein
MKVFLYFFEAMLKVQISLCVFLINLFYQENVRNDNKHNRRMRRMKLSALGEKTYEN